MRNKRKILGIFCCALLFFVAGFAGPVSAEEQHQDPWHKVSTKVDETVEAVGDATRKTVDKTREVVDTTRDKGTQAFDKAREDGKRTLQAGKEESKSLWQQVTARAREIYEQAREGIHKATAPAGSEKPAKAPSSPPAK
jgi:hypothetical protein